MSLLSFLISISLFICTATYCPDITPDIVPEEECEFQQSTPVIGGGVPIRSRSAARTRVLYRMYQDDQRHSPSTSPDSRSSSSSESSSFDPRREPSASPDPLPSSSDETIQEDNEPSYNGPSDEPSDEYSDSPEEPQEHDDEPSTKRRRIEANEIGK